MLKRLLQLIIDEKRYAPQAFAHLLNTDTATVESWFDQLLRLGLITYTPFRAECGGGCAGCASKASCDSQSGPMVVGVTEKGERVAKGAM